MGWEKGVCVCGSVVGGVMLMHFAGRERREKNGMGTGMGREKG